MKRWLVVAVLVLASAAVVYYSERHQIPNRVGPEAVGLAAPHVGRTTVQGPG